MNKVTGQRARSSAPSRREFIQQVAGATGALTVAALSPAESVANARGNTPADGSWPMRRGDRCLTGRAHLPGEIHDAPAIQWKYKIEAGEVWEVIDPGSQNRTSVAATSGAPISAYLKSPEGRRWGLGAPLVDLYGDGELVPAPERAAKLVAGIPGLQTVGFREVKDPSAYGKGQAVFPPVQAVGYAWDTKQPREIWHSEAYPVVQNTNFCVADVDNDGQLEVVLAPHYRVIVINGQNGATKQLLQIHHHRNYGTFSCIDINHDKLLDFIIVANFAMHLDVVQNDGDHLHTLWRRDIEDNIQSKTRIIQPGRNPSLDLNGDGRVEIVVNLFNETGDGEWHVMAYDALTGETVFDLPRSYLQGTADVDADGVPELFAVRSRGLLIPEWGELLLMRAQGSNVTPLWQRQGGKWAKADRPLPLTTAAKESSGIDTTEIVTAKLAHTHARCFFVLEANLQREGQCLAYSVQTDRQVKEEWRTSLPPRSRPQIRASADIDVDGADEILLTYRQRSATDLMTDRSRVGFTRVAALDRVGISPHQDHLTNRVVAVDTSTKSRPLVLFEGADNDIIALEPPGRGNSEPSVRWRAPGAGPVVLADVNGDGIREAVLARRAEDGEGMMVAAELSEGRDLWQHRTAGFAGPHPEWNFSGITTWSVGHYTSMSLDDVWVSARRSTMHSDEAWTLKGSDGSPLWHLREVRTNHTRPGERGWGAGGSFICSADVDGDGLEDVISLYPVDYMAAKGTDGALIHALDAAQGLFKGVWGAYCQPMVADFNNDGVNELLWCGAYHFGMTRLDGTVLWYKLGGAGMAGLGDIDGDGKLELGFAGWENGRGLCCFDAASGEAKWQWSIDGNARVQVISSDINGDGREEFVFAVGQALYALNGAGGLPHLVWKLDLPIAPGELSLADVDGDGKTEILFIGDDSALYCLDRAG